MLSRTSVVGLLLFLGALAVFGLSPIRQVYDSKYTIFFGEQLLRHGSFSLPGGAFPELRSRPTGEQLTRGTTLTYHLLQQGERYYSYFPPGSSILSIPYVAVINLFGVSATDAEGSYDSQGERKIQAGLAALLMAGLCCAIFGISRCFLSFGWSALIAAATAFGTQVWSTASRALWADTWGIFVLSCVLLLFVRTETRGTRRHPVLLATLLSWLYFIRPTYCVPIALISAYLLIYDRRGLLPYLATGAAWLAAFIIFSRYHFGTILPEYYRADRLTFGEGWLALAGNLISPSRGLLTFVPVLVFVAYLLIRYRGDVERRRLLWLSLAVIILHFVIVAGHVPWGGGHAYGPRLSTGLVPWLALLGILAAKARLQRRTADHAIQQHSRFRWRTEWAIGAVLLVLSVTLNGVGATSARAVQWNVVPVNIDAAPERLWDWHDPQFLAPIRRR